MADTSMAATGGNGDELVTKFKRAVDSGDAAGLPVVALRLPGHGLARVIDLVPLATRDVRVVLVERGELGATRLIALERDSHGPFQNRNGHTPGTSSGTSPDKRTTRNAAW